MEKHHTESRPENLFEAKAEYRLKDPEAFHPGAQDCSWQNGLVRRYECAMAYELSKLELYTVSLKTLGEISLYGKAYFHTLLLFAFVGLWS